MNDRRRGLAKLLRLIGPFIFLPVFLLMNACALIIDERRDLARSGLLRAEVIRSNPGALSDYYTVVRVLPRGVPAIWPLDGLLACNAFVFTGDLNTDVSWEGAELHVEHDRVEAPISRRPSCYGRKMTFKDREK